MRFAVYKDKEGDYVGVEASAGFDGEFVRDVELNSWDDFMKFMVMQYGCVGSYVVRDGNVEFLYDVKPDAVCEFRIQIPLWKIDGNWAINVCNGQVLSFRFDESVMMDGDVMVQVFQMMIIEALKKNRFGNVVGDFEVRLTRSDLDE